MIGIDAHDGDLTRAELTWVEGKTEYWIRFGHATGEQILDRETPVSCSNRGTNGNSKPTTFPIVRRLESPNS